jgi:CelD/BcsL family acetyltransferase involved in cellulose biosynthesis
MNVVALRPHPPLTGFLPAGDGRMAWTEIFHTLADAEPHWRALQGGENLATPYQSYDFLRFWQRHVGAAAGVTPLIVVGFNAVGQPLFLWPLGCRTCAGLRVIEFLGGKHANFNMALWRSDAAANINAADLRGVMAQLAHHADLVKLVNQPLTWAGTTNPFALLPQQRSANLGFSGALVPDFEALLRARTNAATRKKMRKKERALSGSNRRAARTTFAACSMPFSNRKARACAAWACRTFSLRPACGVSSRPRRPRKSAAARH